MGDVRVGVEVREGQSHFVIAQIQACPDGAFAIEYLDKEECRGEWRDAAVHRLKSFVRATERQGKHPVLVVNVAGPGEMLSNYMDVEGLPVVPVRVTDKQEQRERDVASVTKRELLRALLGLDQKGKIKWPPRGADLFTRRATERLHICLREFDPNKTAALKDALADEYGVAIALASWKRYGKLS